MADGADRCEPVPAGVHGLLPGGHRDAALRAAARGGNRRHSGEMNAVHLRRVRLRPGRAVTRSGRHGAFVRWSRLLALLAAFGLSVAQTETLEDAWRIALQRGLALAAAESRVAAADAGVGPAPAERRAPLLRAR